MATWKIAPALAAGNCTIVKPAEQTPASIMVLMELIGDLLPKGRHQRRQRFWRRGGQAARDQSAYRKGGVYR
jgi:acyl-CoA reductase-like NAD-dependent aldehyde dehydrogenase